MRLDSFLHNLHFDIDRLDPPDWEVDWNDAPLAYKLYRGLPVVPLSAEVPLTLEGREVPGTPALSDIGHFLWYAFGLAKVCQWELVGDGAEQEGGVTHSFRRFLPSGGALYPSELYLYLRVKDLPAGIYHYDTAHHRLVLLREGDFDSYVARALGNRCDVSACFGTVFVSTMFWKNFFKYHNFSYRLQGLDAGVLIGHLLEVAKRFGFSSGVYFQFLDRAVNHLLGLSEQDESVYAVIPLSVEPGMTWFADRGRDEAITASELCRELRPVAHEHYVRSRRVRPYPMLVRMNEASLLESTRSFRQVEGETHENVKGRTVPLPQVNRLSYDLAAACKKRHSPGIDFVLGRVSQEQLAALLREATASFAYRNDLDGGRANPEPRVSLYLCLHHVEGIPDGAYRYDSGAHALQMERPGDHRLSLQQAMTLDNVNLLQTPLCLHPAGGRDHLQTALGYRGYRIQQMEAGMLVQHVLLAASALGMAGHPLLGYDANMCDEIYGIASRGQTCLIQFPVGPYRPASRLEGSLHA
ncbi:SagB family peptide dehydrogenase [Brevibacillus thermoruber]|uniref:SagB family peptide dehydrogenase n=1 Tax=Brevibacillus thermoruber TaxID=33942 RepID=UPI0005585A40|nr:SagB family peptide dehydrogenase [Brevibacillus thermoruber]